MAHLLLFDAIRLHEGMGHPEQLSEDVPFSDLHCNELDDYYKALRCRLFDIAHYKVGGKYFDIFVDDEGMFAEEPVVSARDKDGNPMLVGNLIFANHDKHGNTTSLTEDDVHTIVNAVRGGFKSDGSLTWWIECEA